MFGFGEQPKAQSGAELSDEMLQQAEQFRSEHPELLGDQHTEAMFDNGFKGPEGNQIDPMAFLEGRLALIKAGEAGATAGPASASEQVVHSMSPEEEPRAELMD